jgi:hypothetical protein
MRPRVSQSVLVGTILMTLAQEDIMTPRRLLKHAANEADARRKPTAEALMQFPFSGETGSSASSGAA